MDLFDHKITSVNYKPLQFIIFRCVLGNYLLLHFISLLPYSAEMFSNEGVFGNPALNFSYGFFPDILNYYDSNLFVRGFLITLILLSILFISGINRRVVSILLWYGWACLVNRNNMIINPGMPYIGWLLLASAFVPEGENKRDVNWTIPSYVIFGAWLIMSLGYTLSGFDKLHSPSWINGSTFSILLENPLSRNTILREVSLNVPSRVFHFITWAALLGELLFLPLSLFTRTRKYAWTTMVIMHLGILCYINFTDLTVGMLMIHLFTFDPAWLNFSLGTNGSKAILLRSGT